jgi:hypothetical protein
MTAASFCTVTASTKRNAALSGNRRGAPAAYLLGLAITPLWPVGNETIRTLAIDSPREFKECYHVPGGVDLPDVDEGDVLVVAGVDYPIHYVGEWTDSAVPCLHIVVQEIKR